MSAAAEGQPWFNVQERGYVEVFDDAGDAAQILTLFEDARRGRCP